MNKKQSQKCGGAIDDEDRKMRKLFVDKLSAVITEDDIYQVFSKHGDIEEVAKYQDRRAPTRYFAFVVYKYAKDCVKATHNPCPIIRGKKCACMLAAIGKQFSGYKFFVQKGLLTEEEKQQNVDSNKHNKKQRQRRHNKNKNKNNNNETLSRPRINIPTFREDQLSSNSSFDTSSPIQYIDHPSWHSHYDSQNTLFASYSPHYNRRPHYHQAHAVSMGYYPTTTDTPRMNHYYSPQPSYISYSTSSNHSHHDIPPIPMTVSAPKLPITHHLTPPYKAKRTVSNPTMFGGKSEPMYSSAKRVVIMAPDIHPDIQSPELLMDLEDDFAEMGIEIGLTPPPPPLLLNAAKSSIDYDKLPVPTFQCIEDAKKASDKELEAGFTMLQSPTPSVHTEYNDDSEDLNGFILSDYEDK